MSSNVAIVMATYNGALHVEEQIRSLQAQDFDGWHLFVRDDGSTDGTPARVAQLAGRDPRITLLQGGARLGVVGNFGHLMAHALAAGAEYVFPCDQDDVWGPGKLSRALALMERLEAERGKDTPLLVHSDLEVVDDALHPIHPSFLRYQGIAHEVRSPLEVLLVQNFVTGCASLSNRALLELALPFPERCIMHDWWLAQCAAAGGAIGFIPEATIQYRQHASNQIGAAGVFGSLNPLRAQGRMRLARSWRTARDTLAQAGALGARLAERGGAAPERIELVERYARIDAEPVWRRVRTLRRLGIRRQRPLGTALLYARMSLMAERSAEGPQAGAGAAPQSIALEPSQVRRRAAYAVVLLALRTGATHLVTLVGAVALARLLGPEEFGIFAVLQFALTFFQFFGDAGLGAALVQRDEAPSPRALASVFTLQVLLAIALTVVVWSAAPALALVWRNLPASATALLRVMSLTFLVTTLRVVPSILLERELRFGAVAAAEVAQVSAFYLVACACAAGGLRVWTWPAALLAQALAGTAVVFAARPWRPRLALDRAVLKPLVRFGLPFQLKNVVGFANGAVTPLYAGRALGASALGLITWGQQVAYLPLRLVEIIARVSFPLFSRMQYDRDALARVLERSLQLCALGVFFTTPLLVTSGRNITVVVFSDRWLGGLVPLYAFSTVLLVGFVSPVVAAVLDALGRPGIIARLASAWTVLNWIAAPVATWRWGFTGFVLGYCVHVVVGNLALLLMLPRFVPGTRVARPLAAPLLGGLVVAGIGWFLLRPWATTPARLAFGVAFALAAHLAVFALAEPRALQEARRLFARTSPAS